MKKYIMNFMMMMNYKIIIQKIPNIKIFNKRNKRKGKINKIKPKECLNKYYCKCGKCMSQIHSLDNFDKIHSTSIFDLSSLLKNYKKESKIINSPKFYGLFLD